jgi:hypothetical protein
MKIALSLLKIKNMKQIEISEEVYDYLNSKAVGFDMNTPDKVLKKLLSIGSKSPNLASQELKISFHWGGADFHEGLQMRVKGKPQETAIVKGGSIVYKGKAFKSPSAAAIASNNGTSTNGWLHWEYLDNSGHWKLIDNLRVSKNK